MSFIELKNVSQAFRQNGTKKVVLDGIDLIVNSGDFICLQGKIGTGKSTLLNFILGLQQPDSGQISVFGYSPNEAESRMRLGSMLQQTQVPDYLTVRELIDLVRSYYPSPLTIDEILRRASLQELQHNRPKTLSGGQQRLLYFALAIAGDPDLLILDEPTASLDNDERKKILQQLKEFSVQNKAVLFITQYPDDREVLADVITRTLILEDGKLQEIQLDHDKEVKQQNPVQAQPLPSFLWVKALVGQFKVELLELVRYPVPLLSILLFYFGGCFIPFFLPKNFQDSALLILTGISAFNIIFTSTNQFGVKLAAERSSGWVRLLRVRPLPPAIYLGAKTLIVLMISAIGVGMMFTVANIRLDITASSMEWIRLFGALLLGSVPFAIIGCVIGYLFTEISVSMMSVFMLALFSLTSLPLQYTENWLNWIPFSPFYHYAQLLQWAVPEGTGQSGFPDMLAQSNPNLLLSLAWLIWTGVVSSLVAIWAYRRDPKVARP